MASLARRALAVVNEFGRLTGWLSWSMVPPAAWVTVLPPPPQTGPAAERRLTRRERRAWTRLCRQLTAPPGQADAGEVTWPRTPSPDR